MKLVDMKRSEEERKEGKPSRVEEFKGPEYPWGLDIRLSEDELSKLGMKAADLSVGEDVRVLAKARVKEITQVDRQDGQEFPESRVEIQIEHLGLERREEYDVAWEEATGR